MIKNTITSFAVYTISDIKFTPRPRVLDPTNARSISVIIIMLEFDLNLELEGGMSVTRMLVPLIITE